ncbi:MAG: tetratricopeptide repeat protein [Phycisphaerae bacterium]|nr:tetratricopeptide repeat protein [Phycisphaerae bacterium]
MIATAVVWLPVLDNGFVQWDDHRVLLGNPDYRGFGWDNLRWMFTTRHMCHYQPLTWLTYAVDYKLWGMNPRGYHLTSLLFHAAAAGVFFWVARHLLRRAGGSDEGREGLGLDVAAAMAALVFAIHPLRVESVAWATERRDLTSGLFLLVSLAAYLRAASAAGAGRGRWLILSWVSYALSLLGKAMGITLPVVLLILDVYPLRRLGRLRDTTGGVSRHGVLIEKAPYAVLAALAAGMAFIGQYLDAPLASVDRVPPQARIAIACHGTVFYLVKTLVPLGLSPLYAPDDPFNPFAVRFLVCGGLVLLISATALLLSRRWPAGLVAWACYLVILSPVVGLVQIGPQIAADRYSYLACLGWAVMVGGGWLWLWQRRGLGGAWSAALMAATIAIAPALTGLGWLTRRQIAVWRDTETLWRQAVRVQPRNAVAQGNLASWLGQHGRLDEAIMHYQKSIEIYAGSASVWCNMGVTLSRRGRAEEAEGAFRKAIEIDPRLASAHRGLGRLLLSSRQAGTAQEGIQHLVRALELDAGDIATRIGLSEHYLRNNHPAQTVELLRDGVRRMPNSVPLAGMLGWVLATCPDDAIRDGVEAARLTRRACELTGSRHPHVLDAYAAALAETGQFDEAVRVARSAAAVARQGRHDDLARAIEERARAYQAHRPWRERL